QVTWSADDTSVATVSNNAGTQGLVTAVTPGTTKVTAALGAASGSVTVTVTAATLQSIAITPANASIAKGTTPQLTAMGTYSDGTQKDVTAQAIWSSDNSAAATISNGTGTQGVATAVAPGAATITAAIGSVTGTTTLTVVLPDPSGTFLLA